MKNWPVWHPGLELKAEHLLGLEDYLLSRVAMTDDRGHGVGDLDWKASLQVSRRGQNLEIVVRGPLRGLTPSRLPVVLEPDESVAAPLDSGTVNAGVFDLWIEIVPGSESQRVNVVLDKVGSSSSPVLPCRVPSRLYLGRYGYGDDGLLELIHRPLVLSLASVQPLDKSWQSWVDPLQSRITALLESLEQEGAQADPQGLLLLSEVTQLAFSWTATHLPELARRLQYVAWLQSRRHGSKGQVILSPDFRHVFPPDDAVGQDIPRLLARFFYVADFPHLLPELLPQLQGEIYYHAPLSAFHQWNEQVTKFRDRRLLNRVSDVLQQRAANRKLDDWSRAIGLLTMTAIDQSLHHEWPYDLKCYLPEAGSSLELGAATVLDRLYQREAQQAPAGPLAFHCLARVAATIPEIVRNLSGGLQTYLSYEAARDGIPNGLDQKLAKRDRVLSHLVARKTLDSRTVDPPSAGPPLVQRWMATKISGTRERAIRVVVAGDAGSGKSSLLKNYCALLQDPGAPLGRFRPRFAVESPSIVSADRPVALKGDIDLSGSRVDLELAEARDEMLLRFRAKPGGLDPRAAIALYCDLLILTIDTSSVDVLPELRPKELFAALAGVANFVRTTNPLAMIAVAYTKSDEFGAADPRALRVIEQTEKVSVFDLISTSRATSLDTSWRIFLESVGAQPTDDKWNMTRTFVVNQSRELWESILRDQQGSCPAINGYFISADPLDEYLKPWPRRGLLQLFGDFFDYYQAVRG